MTAPAPAPPRRSGRPDDGRPPIPGPGTRDPREPPTPENEIDKMLGGAIHEGGHIVVFDNAGIRMGMVEIRARSNRLGGEGGVWLEDGQKWTDAKWHLMLVGTIAGVVAHAQWLVWEHGWDPARAKSFADIGGGGDFPMFAKFSQGTGLTVTQARVEARRHVVRHWSRIYRGGLRLRREQRMKASKV